MPTKKWQSRLLTQQPFSTLLWPMVFFCWSLTLKALVPIHSVSCLEDPVVVRGRQSLRIRGGGGGMQDTSNTVLCRLIVLDTLMNSDPLGTLVPEKIPGWKKVVIRAKFLLSRKQDVACIPVHVDNDEDDGDPNEHDDMFPLPPSLTVGMESSELKRGLFCELTGAYFDGEQLLLSDNVTARILDPVHQDELRDRYLQSTTNSNISTDSNTSNMTMGTKTVAIIRVSTADASPSISLNNLSDGLLSPLMINMKTQYAACSFNQLKWVLGDFGARDVLVNEPIANFQDGSGTALVTAAQKVLKAELGIPRLHTIADRVIFCLPPGTGDWVGSAGMGYWKAQFNDEWCLSLTATMHELGHTLGLAHSNEGNETYGDATGYMSYGYKNTNWPQKCFNGVQSWQLGWYESRSYTMNMLDGHLETVRLAAFPDFHKCTEQEHVLININNILYLIYNRAKRFNVDTMEKKNQVTITRASPGGSDCVAGLRLHGKLEMTNFARSGRTLVIEVCDTWAGNIASPDFMVLSIGLDKSLCTRVLGAAPAAAAEEPVVVHNQQLPGTTSAVETTPPSRPTTATATTNSSQTQNLLPPQPVNTDRSTPLQQNKSQTTTSHTFNSGTVESDHEIANKKQPLPESPTRIDRLVETDTSNREIRH